MNSVAQMIHADLSKICRSSGMQYCRKAMAQKLGLWVVHVDVMAEQRGGSQKAF